MEKDREREKERDGVGQRERERKREGGKRVVELAEGGGRVKPPAADR